ncbi:MAG: polysaccharide biosynthesis C-terminal domain-containing protein [Deltaproteobacteria bacterium]|nr:polysaccharide biosynthesis C-terminal domain-containing protein [Deltaproteobacteria bacterium]
MPAGGSSDEKSVRSASRKVARGGVINILGNLVGLVDPLFMMAVSWLLGAGTLGSYVLATTYVAMLLRLGVMGLDKGLLRHLPMARASDSPEENQARVLGTALRWIAGLSLVGTAAVYLLSGVIAARGGGDAAGDAAWWLSIMVFAVPGEAITFFYLFALRGANRMGPFVLVRQLIRPLLLFAVAMPAIALGAGKTSLVIAYLAAQYGSVLVGHVLYMKAFPRFGFLRILRASQDRSLLSFAFPQGLTEFLNYLLARADILMISFFFPGKPELLAVYAVASMLAGVVKKVRQAFDTSMAPVISDQIARGETDLLRTTYQRASRWIFAPFLGLSGILVFGAPLLLAAFGPEYPAYWLVVPILIGGRFLNAAGGPAQMALLMAGKSRLELLNNVLTNAGNIAFNLYMIPRFGIYGAAIATATSVTLFNMARIAQVLVLLRIGPKLRDVARIVLTGALAAAPAVLVLTLPGGLLRHAVALPIFVVCYLVIVYLVGMRSDLKTLYRYLARRRRKPTSVSGQETR